MEERLGQLVEGLNADVVADMRGGESGVEVGKLAEIGWEVDGSVREGALVEFLEACMREFASDEECARVAGVGFGVLLDALVQTQAEGVTGGGVWPSGRDAVSLVRARLTASSSASSPSPSSPTPASETPKTAESFLATHLLSNWTMWGRVVAGKERTIVHKVDVVVEKPLKPLPLEEAKEEGSGE